MKAAAGARSEKRDDKEIEKAKIQVKAKNNLNIPEKKECKSSGGKDKKNKQCNKTTPNTKRIFKCKAFSPHPSSLQRKTHTDRCDSFV